MSRKSIGEGEWPKITIVTPSLNQGGFLEQTIKSVLDQGYPNLEYFIIDGGSTDNSAGIIKRYSDRIDYWVSEPDHGQAHALNKGFSHSTGVILGWLNADDTLVDGALATVASCWREIGGFDVLAGDGEIVDESGRASIWLVRDKPTSREQLLEYANGRYLPQPAVYFSRKAFVQVGGLREDLHYTMDLDLWLRFSRLYKIETVARTLARLRAHSGAKTFKDNEKVYAEVLKLIRTYGTDLGRADRSRIMDATRFQLAQALCWKAAAYRAQAQKAGWAGSSARLLLRAVLTYPAIVFRRVWLGALIRAYLPVSLFPRSS